jgi:ABC-type multidrug transport system permease subunit
MATLLHFLRSLLITLLASFLFVLGGLWGLFNALAMLNQSPAFVFCEPLYFKVSQFLQVFGGGDRFEGMVAIALPIAFVAALLNGFTTLKRNQRSEWRLAMLED